MNLFLQLQFRYTILYKDSFLIGVARLGGPEMLMAETKLKMSICTRCVILWIKRTKHNLT